MFVTKIRTLNDVLLIYKGIEIGVEEKAFKDAPTTQLIRQIVSTETQFFIFVDNGERVGFAGIQGNEIVKVFVFPKYRRKGYGMAIHMVMAKYILDDGNLPFCIIRDTNTEWKDRIKCSGFTEYDYVAKDGIHKCRIRDFFAFGDAWKKHVLDKNLEVVMPKKDKNRKLYWRQTNEQ